ncbi:MAG: PQQ-binding-like beta-propeller repeat protein [Deltaproteobacteria bacterium]|nr:PQQ-binding-like beta-propeller repeat protein [Deltaproteobacteria bacterium]
MSRGGAGNGLLAVGDRLGMLHVLDLEGNLRWRIQLTETPAAIIGRPAMDETHLYAVTEHGLIAALAL